MSGSSALSHDNSSYSYTAADSDDTAYTSISSINTQDAYILDDEPPPIWPFSSGNCHSDIGNDASIDTTISGLNDQANDDNRSIPDFSDDDHYSYHVNCICFPHQNKPVHHLALDIGGSLAKLVYFTPNALTHTAEGEMCKGGRLNFVKVDTDKIDKCISFMQTLLDSRANAEVDGSYQSPHTATVTPTVRQRERVIATGGGAFKFYALIRDSLNVHVSREDEMDCLITDFLITSVPNEAFSYGEDDTVHFETAQDKVYPYLLVNIGSGVSMIKVTNARESVRVGGTSLGGGTLWGLLSLLTGARNFEEMLEASDHGDNTAVDMLVGDIYGTNYEKIGLKSSTIASSFGKVYKLKRAAERDAEDHGGLAHERDDMVVKGNGSRATERRPATSVCVSPVVTGHTTNNQIAFRPADISRSLLYAISNNIGQIAHLHAELHGVQRIYFAGSFIAGHRQTIRTLSYAIRFWSHGAQRALFLRHEGYLGAVGAFMKS